MRLFLTRMTIALAVFIIGCQRAYEFPESVREDMKVLPQRIMNPTVDPVHYANKLLNDVASLSNTKEKFACQREWEKLIYQVKVDSPDLHTRYDQIVAFCDISGLASYCILKIGGTEEDYWESRIRLLKWMQNLIAGLAPQILPDLIARNDHRPRTKEELMVRQAKLG